MPYEQNACRKQKMRCEGADNPPCKRCRHAGLECLFEKPVRDTSTTEQGLECVLHPNRAIRTSSKLAICFRRIRNLENQVGTIQSTLSELVLALRASGPSRPGSSQVHTLSYAGPGISPIVSNAAGAHGGKRERFSHLLSQCRSESAAVI